MSFIQVIYICWKIPQLEKERDLQCLENGFTIKTEFCFTPEERSVCRYDERDNRVLRRMLFLRVYCPVGRLFFSAFSLDCDVFLNHTVILFSLSIL